MCKCGGQNGNIRGGHKATYAGRVARPIQLIECDAAAYAARRRSPPRAAARRKRAAAASLPNGGQTTCLPPARTSVTAGDREQWTVPTGAEPHVSSDSADTKAIG